MPTSSVSSKSSAHSLQDEAVEQLLDFILVDGGSDSLTSRVKAEDRLWRDVLKNEVPGYFPKLLQVYKCGLSTTCITEPEKLMQWLVDNTVYSASSLAVVVDGIHRGGLFQPDQEVLSDYVLRYLACDDHSALCEMTILHEFLIICFDSCALNRAAFFSFISQHELPSNFQVQLSVSMCSCEELEWNVAFMTFLLQALTTSPSILDVMIAHNIFVPALVTSMRCVSLFQEIEWNCITTRFMITPHIISPCHIAAATDIQRFVRGCLSRGKAKALRKRLFSANQIQKTLRGFIQRKRLTVSKSALVIQKAWKCYRARCRLKSLAFERRCENSARTIQNYRLIIAAKKLAFATLASKLKNFAGMVVLNFMRMVVARSKTCKVYYQGDHYTKIPTSELFYRYKPFLGKIYRLQRYAKVLSASRVIDRIRHERKVNRAPILIQAAYRRHLAAKRVKTLKKLAHQFEESVIRIQRIWKGAAARQKWRPKIQHALTRLELLTEESRLMQLMNRKYELGRTMAESEDSSQFDILDDIQRRRCLLRTEKEQQISPSSRLYLSSIRNSSRHAKLAPYNFKKTQRYLCDSHSKTPFLGYSQPDVISFTKTPTTSVLSASNLTAVGASRLSSSVHTHKRPKIKVLRSRCKQPAITSRVPSEWLDWCSSTTVPPPERSPPIGEVYRKSHHAARVVPQYCKGSTTLFLSKSSVALPQLQNINNLPVSKALEVILRVS